MGRERLYDCIIIGAGPGGLQAAIHLARFNRRVLLMDRGGGRTRLAGHIVNYLGIPAIDGLELIRIGFLQGRSFGVTVKSRTAVTKISKRKFFKVQTAAEGFLGRYVIAASGAKDILPGMKNLSAFLGKGFYTCMESDGRQTADTELVVMGDNADAVRMALEMKKMYTDQITLLVDDFTLPPDSLDLLLDARITVVKGTPVEILGQKRLTGLRLTDGRSLSCQTVMANYGWQLNDQYLQDLKLARDAGNFRILADRTGETSIPGLFVTGALRPDSAQAIIAAGQGATAAIEINTRLLAL